MNSNAAYEPELIALLNAAFPLHARALPPPEYAPPVWQQLSDTAQRNGLATMFFRAIEILERNDVPDELVKAGRDTYRRSVLAQALAYRELEAVMQECAQEKIALVALKGAVLAKTLYPEPALRPFGDLDILIHRDDALRLRAMLLARGLTEAKVIYGFDPLNYGEMPFFASNAQELMVDLHWELVVPMYYRQRMDLNWFWERTETFAVGVQTGLRFNATAQFVHLAIHAGLHHQDNLRLVWLYDLALLITQRGSQIDWRAADAFAKKAGLLRPIRAMLDATRVKWGVPLPPETDALFQPLPLALVERAVYAVATTRYPEARMLADALATPGMGNKWNFVRQHIFPDAAYMHTRYHFSNDALLPLYYVRRVVGSGFIFMRSLWTAVTRK